MVMHASLRTNDDHEDHMESTRDETPSLQLSMANWHAGVRLLLLLWGVLRRGAIGVRWLPTIGILHPIWSLRGRLRLCLLRGEET